MAAGILPAPRASAAPHLCCVLLCLLACSQLVERASAEAVRRDSNGRTAVVIALKARIEATQDPILLGNVADIVTGDRQLAARLAEIDLADLGPNRTTHVTQRHVSVRLQLAGYSPDSFRVVGADHVEISAGQLAIGRPTPRVAASPVPTATAIPSANAVPSAMAGIPMAGIPMEGRTTPIPPEQQVVQQLQAKLADQWMIDSTEIEVRLLQPLFTVKAKSPGQSLRYEVTIAAEQKGGKIWPRVYVYAGTQLLDVKTVAVEALRQYETVVVTQRIDRGQELTRQDLEPRQQLLPQRGQLLSLEGALGQIARRTMEPGQSVRNYDLQSRQATSPATRRGTQAAKTAIRRRDTVRLVARTGNLTVMIADGQALDDAAVGESIRVRNPRSKLIVVGRVVSRNQVEVEL